MIIQQPFGRTGHMSSRIIFGGFALSKASQAEADRALDILLKYGVNHIDTAASYGDSELWIGPWMAQHRQDFFLATKTGKRTYQEAWDDIQHSLERLQVDHVDLLQLHYLVDPEEWEIAMGPGGALEAAIEARRQGLVRFIGITGHDTSVAAMHLFRPNADILEDMFEDPEWVEEMARIATDWTMDWIRAQYQAGANSITFLAEVMGTLMVSPSMAERFNLENITRVARMVRQEFGRGTWLHTHGNMTNPKAYAYLTKLATEAGLEGFHFDEMDNPPEWIKEQVVDRFGVSACIITDGHKIVKGPVEAIRAEVKEQISRIGDGLGIMMAPSCQLLPATPNEHFKAWIDATHEFGAYPLRS